VLESSIQTHGSWSIIADICPLPEIFRKCGLGWSPRPILIALMLKAMPASPSRIVIFLARGVGQKTQVDHAVYSFALLRRSGGCQTNRQMLQSVDEVGSESRNVSDKLGLRRPLHQLFEHDGDLHARQVRAEAVVLSAAAECDMLVRRALDVEAERIIKDGLVAIRGDVPD